MKDFFISYNRADRAWAVWIAWHLEAEGFSTVNQEWDFRPGSNFVLEMDRAMKEAERVIAVLSPTYLTSKFTAPEWAAYLAEDPTGVDRRLIPVRVGECDLDGLLRQVVYIDLVGTAEEEARQRLLAGVRNGRAKPQSPPPFPGLAPKFPGAPMQVASGASCRLPGPPRCFGRDDEVRDLVDSLCADPPPPVPILGPPGVGKTTITLAALHNRRVVERFGKRRYFVRCDNATSRDGLMGEIARWMQLETGPQLEAQVFVELERGPAVLALDNAETPWWADTIATEDLLSQLCGISGLALVASIRGEQRPLGPAWREAIRVGPLDLPAACTAFLAVAGQRFSSDPDLVRLLEAVDRVALAVTLLAHQAEIETDLSDLWECWQEKRTELLRRAGGKERLTNIEVSLELSISSPHMTEGSRRLLSLLGLLPDGVAREDLVALLPEVEEAAAVLRQVGLAFAQEQRLRALAPVREYVHSRYPPDEVDQGRTIAHYVELAKKGEGVGYKGGAEVVRRLASELGNIDAMIFIGLGSSDPRPAILAAQALAKLMRFTGLGRPSALERAREIAKGKGDESLEADCIQSLGDFALHRSDLDASRQRYEEALPLYRRCGDLLGEANCIQRLGEIALRRSDHDDARQRYEEALPLYRRVGGLLGEAHCIQSLGDIALQRSDHDVARQRYEQALPLFRGAGDLLGEAICIASLGNIALQRSDHDAARQRYEEALPLFRRVGDLLGEANCIQGLGDIALRRSDPDAARAKFQEALGRYEQVSDPYSIGWAHVRLARIASDETRRQHVEAARGAWESVKRPDLIEVLRQEFGDLFPDPASTEPALQ